MAKKIAIANHKGGVAKTATSINLSAGLAREGYRVLAIDVDPQASLTKGFGWENTSELSRTLYHAMYDFLEGRDPRIEETILHHTEGVDIIPNCILCSKMEKILFTAYMREKVLLKTILPIVDNYDYIIIDCPPSILHLTTNALVAADSVIIPCQPEDFSVDGLNQFIESVAEVKRNVNFDLQIDGILITRIDYRYKHHNETAAQIRQDYANNGGLYVFKNEIPQRAGLLSAVEAGKSVFVVDPRGDETEAYRGLVKEVIGNGNQITRGNVFAGTIRSSHI